MSVDINIAQKQPAYLCGYSLDGGSLSPLSSSNDALAARAGKTAALWRAISHSLAEHDTVTVRQAGKVSVCLAKGGIVIEAKSNLNLGLMRLMVRSIETTNLPQMAPEDFANAKTPPLLSLGRWLEQTEAGRMIELSVADETFKIWAEKGQFEVVDGRSSDLIAQAVQKATAEGLPVQLRYNDANGYKMSKGDQAVSLVGDVGPDELWRFNADLELIQRPACETVDEIERVTMIADAFNAWSEGEASDVTVSAIDGSILMKAHSDLDGVFTLSFL